MRSAEAGVTQMCEKKKSKGEMERDLCSHMDSPYHSTNAVVQLTLPWLVMVQQAYGC